MIKDYPFLIVVIIKVIQSPVQSQFFYEVQKPAVLTTSGRSVNNFNIYQDIRDYTPATGVQKNPAERGVCY
jgi:hypothetical protein